MLPSMEQGAPVVAKFKCTSFKRGKWRARVGPLKESEKAMLPEHLSRLSELSGGHYKDAIDAGRASDKILYKLGRATNLLLSQQELDTVNALTWDQLMASFRASSRRGGGSGSLAGLRGTSTYRGVCWHKASRKWETSIHVVGDVKAHLGIFDSEEDAARAYDTAAHYLRGSTAKLNFKNQKPLPPDARMLAKLRALQSKGATFLQHAAPAYAAAQGPASLTTPLGEVAPSGQLHGGAAWFWQLPLEVRQMLKTEDEAAEPAGSGGGGYEPATEQYYRPPELSGRGSSVYRGVGWEKKKKKWRARIGNEGVAAACLGYFDCEQEAARKYDQAAAYLHGSSARLNFKDKKPPPPDEHMLIKLRPMKARSAAAAAAASAGGDSDGAAAGAVMPAGTARQIIARKAAAAPRRSEAEVLMEEAWVQAAMHHPLDHVEEGSDGEGSSGAGGLHVLRELLPPWQTMVPPTGRNARRSNATDDSSGAGDENGGGWQQQEQQGGFHEQQENGEVGSQGYGSGGGNRGTQTWRGVSWDKKTKKWRARIGIEGARRACLGYFDTGEAAARAYDVAAAFLHGGSARLNFKTKMPPPPDAALLSKLQMHKRRADGGARCSRGAAATVLAGGRKRRQQASESEDDFDEGGETTEEGDDSSFSQGDGYEEQETEEAEEAQPAWRQRKRVRGGRASSAELVVPDDGMGCEVGGTGSMGMAEQRQPQHMQSLMAQQQQEMGVMQQQQRPERGTVQQLRQLQHEPAMGAMQQQQLGMDAMMQQHYQHHAMQMYCQQTMGLWHPANATWLGQLPQGWEGTLTLSAAAPPQPPPQPQQKLLQQQVAATRMAALHHAVMLGMQQCA